MKGLLIKGFVETSFCDWDGKVASVVFLPGCNLRCPFCQNGDLIENYDKIPSIDPASIISYLDKYRGWIDGVVLTGGEPTLWKGVEQFATLIKQKGFGVKLDTNGTLPDVLRQLINKKLVDYIAMDLKAPLDERYHVACGKRVDLDLIRESVALLRTMGVNYEFRTTLVPGIVGEQEIVEIAREIQGADKYVLQRFVPENSLDNGLRDRVPYDDSFISHLVERAKEYVEICYYRGRTGAGLSTQGGLFNEEDL